MIMKVYQIKRTLLFDRPIEEIWDFFSFPLNLARITPHHMAFEIKSELPGEMYAGMIIEYRVRPLFNIPVTWVTEITRLQKPAIFIDEQRIGPYAFWHHQHHVRSVKNGTEVTDMVHYSLPFGILGTFLHWLFIKSQLNAIFDYREKALEALLPQRPIQQQLTT
jgi:ligand-binding SRPBCC domain-containing protein